MWALYTAKILGIGLIGLLFLEKDWPSYFYFFPSALFLGGITFTMVLGHWYLLTPKLTERPLVHALRTIWAVMALKIGITVWGFIHAQEFFFRENALNGTFNWLMLVMRMTWGYLIIALLSCFAWRLVLMRSIQSATGIFYVMTFFVFIGELVSSYLFYHHGLKI